MERRMNLTQNELTPLKDVIRSLLGDGTLPFNPDDAEIWEVWDEVIGCEASMNARPSGIKGNRLMVTVSDPIWLQELLFRERGIIEELNKKLGRMAVNKIEFRVGPK